ncbi:phosphoenolpyruvate carboxykinase [Gallicola sp. Sow4_E12]|uniref:phosphoenolpyruvate carboxykinase n=1 Tax=Gallicola sp. Sow4_E12 TaxID=3438785 RepID=UPI003F908478
MKKAWSLSNDKAMINFSINYCDTEEKVLESEAFLSVLRHFFKKASQSKDKHYNLLKNYVKDFDDAEEYLILLAKLLTILSSKEISEHFRAYMDVYEKRNEFNSLVEDVYTYWRNLERYGMIYETKGPKGIGQSSFLDSKMNFDNLILSMYRKITANLIMETPSVYRQVPAGTNVGLVLKDTVWPIPEGYESLTDIPFIKDLYIETPFITYPKRNKRDGFFEEVKTNPMPSLGINPNHFFCYPMWVGDLLTFVFGHRDFMTHIISLSNLFQMAKETEIAGRKPDLMLIFGANEPDMKAANGYYIDSENEIVLGFVSHHEDHDYFGYMKKMTLTLHNILQMRRGYLPIHGAMVHIKTQDGSCANVVIMGDSGAGKSESIEAFRSLAEDYISDMTVVFDDMGTFRYLNDENRLVGVGTEIGAFVRLDDLDAGYAFKQLDRSIFMNPDKINARLITPIATYEEIIKGYNIDMFLYANNYDRIDENESSIHLFDSKKEAKEVFTAGKRMAKGTTTEEGLTTSYFANPFGPYQCKERCSELIDQYFDILYDKKIYVGEIRTQLGIKGFERKGAEKAALDLFEMMKKLNLK